MQLDFPQAAWLGSTDGKLVRLQIFTSRRGPRSRRAVGVGDVAGERRVVQRGVDAYNRRDAQGLIDALDPTVEWHPALLVRLGGEPTVYRGHEGLRELVRDTDETLAEIHVEFRRFATPGIGSSRLATSTREARRAAPDDSPLGYVADFRDGKLTRIRTYLDPEEALEAAGLSE